MFNDFPSLCMLLSFGVLCSMAFSDTLYVSVVLVVSVAFHWLYMDCPDLIRVFLMICSRMPSIAFVWVSFGFLGVPWSSHDVCSGSLCLSPCIHMYVYIQRLVIRGSDP